MENNIVLFDKGVLLDGPWEKIDITMDSNCYWNTTGKVKILDKDLAEWQKLNRDKHSIIADPGFENPKKLDFNLKPNSPALKIMTLLKERGMQNIDYNDPWVPTVKVNGAEMKSVEITPEKIADYDVVVIATNHSSYDYKMIVKQAKSIVDTRNATKEIADTEDKITRLGTGVRF